MPKFELLFSICKIYSGNWDEYIIKRYSFTKLG